MTRVVLSRVKFTHARSLETKSVVPILSPDVGISPTIFSDAIIKAWNDPVSFIEVIGTHWGQGH